MPHTPRVHSPNRMRVTHMLVLAIIAVLLIFTSLSFRADSARAQTNNATVTPVATAGTEPVWQATLVLTHTDTVYSVAWAPDGSKLVSGDWDGNVHVWDATTGASLLTMSGHSDDVTGVAWAPDGSKIASVSDDKSVRIWDAATGSTLHTLTGHSGRLDSVLWSPDSTKVVSASPIDESVRIWDATTGASLLTLTLPSASNVTSVAWSPDGTKLASTTNDQSILVWDGATGDTLLTLTGFTGTPSQLAWSPDGSKIASGSFDNSLRVWDATTGSNLLTVDNGIGTNSVAWSPDGSKIASVDGGGDFVVVSDAATGAALQTLPASVTASSPVHWSPDSTKITTATWNLTVLIWDVASGASLAALPGHGDGVTGGGNLAMAWSPDGSRLATAGGVSVRVWAAGATVTPTVAPVVATPAATAVTLATPEPVTPDPTATPMSIPTATPKPTADPNALAFDPLSLDFVWVKGSRSNPASQSVLARNVGKLTYSSGSWIKVPTTKWVTGGLRMDIAVAPANANLDVGVHESKVELISNGMTITLPVKITVVSADGKLQVNRNRLNFGGFLGDPIAEQVVDLAFTGLNSANWTTSGPSWLTLTPANGSVSATAPTALTVGVNTAAISGEGKYTDILTVSDGKTTHEITVELAQVAPGSPTIQLFGLEVTQGIQNLHNDIPFVAERPVFVRGHVRSLTGERIEKVTAQLIGTRDGADLGTLNPINLGGSINIVADPDRAQLNESFLFELPPSWRTGTVTVRLAGQSQPIACVDPAEKSNANGVADDCTVSLTYETVPALPITYFLYKEQGYFDYSDGRRRSATTFTANADHASATSLQLLAGLPIPRVDPQIHATTLTFPVIRGSAEQAKADAMMRAEHEKAGKPIRHFYGLFARYNLATDPKANFVGGPGGAAVVPGFFGFGEYYTSQPMATLNMHEIGHNLGRNHVNCGNPASPDPNFPHPNQQISDVLSGNEAYYGFNIIDQAIYPPTHKDLMSYCWPQWISPYSYKAMMERLKIHYNPPAGNSGAGQAAASPGSPILLINGHITGTVAGSIEGVVSDNANAAIPAADASDYSLRLEDANGETIATYPVTPQLVEGQNHEDFIVYTAAVPQPENLARVVLQYETQPLTERVASASAPTLTLTISGSQSLSITWSASDADGDELRFNVDYSIDDGASWQKLVWDWPETALEIDSTKLPGSTQARIRVSANDGFHTTFAESAAFAVADHPPVAIILSTDLNRYYVGGQTILLEGTGYDLEDGMLSGSDLTWHSDRDGVLGTGPTLAVDADNLAEGPHLIWLEATDSTGQSSFGDSTMGVAGEAGFVAANDTVSFDILYDPLTLPAELVVAPDLGFFTTSGATQLLTGTLAVNNLGDGDLGWTASSDAAHVTLNSNSGNTPAMVVVTVNPTGLADGLHEGTLTFTPTEATLAPVTVDYFINVYAPSPLDIAQNNAYVVENQWGGADTPWSDGGMWVIGGRQDQHVVALDITSTDDGQTLVGTVAYAGEGQIGFRAAKTEQNTYLVENQWGGADAPWNPGGIWVLGTREDQSIVALSISSEDDGNTLNGTMTYVGEGTIGFRAILQPASTLDESDAANENTSDQADAESETRIDDAELPTAGSDTTSDVAPQIAICDATDVPAPTHGGVTVRFVNESEAIVVAYWRDFNGNLMEYHRLDPDGFADQETFATHAWVVEDEAGNVLLDYTVSAEATQCVLIEQP
ncbi:MAG: hypothetical protein IT328_19835 [Caldilineaceae bacterium]|nr:hypothetical protein [Caldilineaceae bacterium]